ncbi:hypothetical protein PoB_003185700 [Plakobranchus ocellatus]|uniref:Secreted protein n=1 Tax=Plakobranchus ocellatus TaxID=259542 RepID=A0AAV4AEN3_9GAST|nr:hypothetical protein PoB_003185700 [Plakobranchus ocellatus]
MGTLLYFSGLMDAALLSTAWSPVYCMSRRRNSRIIFATMIMTSLSCRQRISLSDLLASSMGRSSNIYRHSKNTCKIVSLFFPHRQHLVVADQPYRARSDRKGVCLVLARKICTVQTL